MTQLLDHKKKVFKLIFYCSHSSISLQYLPSRRLKLWLHVHCYWQQCLGPQTSKKKGYWKKSHSMMLRALLALQHILHFVLRPQQAFFLKTSSLAPSIFLSTLTCFLVAAEQKSLHDMTPSFTLCMLHLKYLCVYISQEVLQLSNLSRAHQVVHHLSMLRWWKWDLWL